MREQEQERTIWVDLVRIIAILLMMLYHLCGKGMWWATTEQYNIDYTSFTYRSLIFFHMISRICIPVLLMISGMFLLDPKRNLTVSKLYRHNILRIVLSLFFWNALYSVYFTYRNRQSGDSFLALFSKHFVETHYHLVFLYALIAAYIVVPIVRLLVCNLTKKTWRYLFSVFVIGICIVPTLQMILRQTGLSILNYFNMFFPQYVSNTSGIGYMVFFILGYYLKESKISKNVLVKISFGTAILGIFEVIVRPYFPEIIGQLGYYDFGTILGSIVFVCWMKRKFENYQFSLKIKSVIIKLSKWSFGAYLVHDFTMQFLVDSKSYLILEQPIIGIALCEVIVVVVSFCVSALINQIPIIKKFLV